MDRSTRQLVWQRANAHREYCRVPSAISSVSFEIDHIVAIQHGGETVPQNLALSCLRCNCRKGPNLSGIDTETGEIVRLFHPRRDNWSDHFFWEGPFLRGYTPVGRATIAVLAINHPDFVAERKIQIEAGLFSQEAE